MALLYVDPGWTHIVHEEVAIADIKKTYMEANVSSEIVKSDKLLLTDFMLIYWATRVENKLEGIGYQIPGKTCLYFEKEGRENG